MVSLCGLIFISFHYVFVDQVYFVCELLVYTLPALFCLFA